MEKIHYEILKVLYENNVEISKNGTGWSGPIIINKIQIEEFSRKEKQAALTYLVDIKYVIKHTEKIRMTIGNSANSNDRHIQYGDGAITCESYRISPSGIMAYKKEREQMTTSSEMQSMIDSDICDLTSALSDRSNTETMEYAKLELYKRVGNQYDAYIPDFGMGLYCYIPNLHFYDDVSGDSLFQNMSTMLAKLRVFKAVGYPIQNKNQNSVISFNPSITNTNSNQINLNITFQAAKEKIEEIGSLTRPETIEIIEQINELEEIINSSDNKRAKWDKIKPFLVWLADKGVEVGIALLPLLLNLH